MIRTIKKSIAKATWPYRRYLGQAKKLKKILQDENHITPRAVNIQQIAAADILLITFIGPNTSSLESFLQHYRKLGVKHFLLVDGSNNLEIESILSVQPDVSIWVPTLSLASPEAATRLYNTLLHKFCLRKWTFCVEPDEFFVFPYCESRSISDLTGILIDLERNTIWAAKIDLFSDGPIATADPNSENFKYFDPSGYYQSYGARGQIQLFGGVTARLTPGRPIKSSPPLHRIPLIKCESHIFYEYRNQSVSIDKLNWPHKWHPCPTAVLLTRRYHSDYARQLLTSEALPLSPAHSLLTDQALKGRLETNSKSTLMTSFSQPYQSSLSLIEFGLMCDGGALRPTARHSIQES